MIEMKLRKARKVIRDSVTRKVNLAVGEALLEHKRKNVPYVILGSNGIIYEVYSDGTHVPVDKVEEVRYAQRIN